MSRPDLAEHPIGALRAYLAERQRWTWVVPLLVALFLERAGTGEVERVVEALVALAALLPFHLLGLALLYHFGLPSAVVRGLASWKEGLGIGVLAAAVVASVRFRQRFDLVDKLAFGYLAIVVFYLALPRVIAPSGLLTTGAPLAWGIRLLGLRADIGFVLLFLAARHAAIAPEYRDRLVRVLVATGVVVAGIGIYHFVSPDGWRNFVLQTAEVPRYETNVVRLSPAGLDSLLQALNVTPVRAGSVLVSPFALGDYLLISFALGIELMTRDRHRLFSHVAVPVIGVGLVMTFAHAGVVGALVVVLVATRPLPGRRGSARLRFAALAAIVVVLAAPGLYQTRLSGARGGGTSSVEHVRETMTGIANLTKVPLGTGLGTAPGVGDRFSTPQTIVSDNSYVQVGNELGILAMLVFVVLLVALVPALRRGAMADPSNPLCAGARGACIGLIVAGLFHHVWIDFPVSWTFWMTAGLALGVSDRLTVGLQERGGTLSRHRPPPLPTSRTTNPWSFGST